MIWEKCQIEAESQPDTKKLNNPWKSYGRNKNIIYTKRICIT